VDVCVFDKLHIYTDYSANDIFFSTLQPAIMHRHKVVARMFLLLSIVNFTSAGLAHTPKMHEVRQDPVPGATNVAGPSEELPQLPGRPSTARPSHASVDDIVPASARPSYASVDDIVPASTRPSYASVDGIAPTSTRPSHASVDDVVPTVSAPKSDIAEDLEKNKFFNLEMNRKVKEYVILGSLAGLFMGVANGVQKEIMGTMAPSAYVIFYRSSLAPPANT
jgi:hypothetical protein